MSHEIKDMLEANFPVTIDNKLAIAIQKLVAAYRTRGTNPLAFDSPYLGLQPCYFLTKDRDAFLELFQCRGTELDKIFSMPGKYGATQGLTGRNFFAKMTKELSNLVKYLTPMLTKSFTLSGVAAGDIRKIIAEMSSVDKNFRVASDPMNIFLTYILYRTANANIPKKAIHDTMFDLVMYLQYKFFTSLVNWRFRHKPDEATMVAMFENLTNKFDLKQYGTWSKLMEARAEAFVEEGGLHWNTFKAFDDDSKILYFITDVQTRLRNQINIITSEFMNTKARHDKIGSYSHVGSDEDGEKIVLSEAQGFDHMIASLYNDILSVPRFMDNNALTIVHGMFRGLPLAKLRAMFIHFSELAVKQAKAGQNQLVKEENGNLVYVGAQILTQKLIQKTYRYCINSKVDINKIAAILKAVKDVYSSSRVQDEGILQVRASVDVVIRQLIENTRVATLAQYRIAFVLYLIILSFRYLH